MKRLTDKSLWEGLYYASQRPNEIAITGFRNFSDRQIYERLGQIPLAGKEILEIGAGDSLWLPFLSKMYPASRFTGLDYSEVGCNMLLERARSQNVDIEIVQADFFKPPRALLNKFDVAISFGVVEHFDDLTEVLCAIKAFVKPGGWLFTMIPNMLGVMGWLTKKFNKEVYEAHTPHNLASFIKGHENAELDVIKASYLCSTNFGMLAMSVQNARQATHEFYRFLTRVSKFIWIFESHLFRLPTSVAFSPYIFCISRRSK